MDAKHGRNPKRLIPKQHLTTSRSTDASQCVKAVLLGGSRPHRQTASLQVTVRYRGGGRMAGVSFDLHQQASAGIRAILVTALPKLIRRNIGKKMAAA